MKGTEADLQRFRAVLSQPLANPQKLLSELIEAGAVNGSVKNAGVPPASRIAPPEPGISSNGTLAGTRVLLAEDTPTNQLLARTLLEKLGCRVDLAVNGREAWETIRREHYDIILMDCHMPEMDGYEATGWIRDWESGRLNSTRLPIIALTANALAGDREKCLAAGMDDHLSKPIRKADLERTLTEWLARDGRQAADLA
jgi:CheY-like chemotaxis protein